MSDEQIKKNQSAIELLTTINPCTDPGCEVCKMLDGDIGTVGPFPPEPSNGYVPAWFVRPVLETPEDIWQAFERILKEHGPIETETPEEAAKKWRQHQEDCVAPCVECGLTRDDDGFLAGVQWAKEHPEAMVHWKP